MEWGRGATTATAEQPPIEWGGGQRRGDRCRDNNHRRDDYNDYANHGVEMDDATGLWSEEEDQDDG